MKPTLTTLDQFALVCFLCLIVGAGLLWGIGAVLVIFGIGGLSTAVGLALLKRREVKE